MEWWWEVSKVTLFATKEETNANIHVSTTLTYTSPVSKPFVGSLVEYESHFDASSYSSSFGPWMESPEKNEWGPVLAIHKL